MDAAWEVNPSRRGGRSAAHDIRLGLEPKGTTMVPLDGATRGSGRTRVPVRGAMAEPPSPRRVCCELSAVLCRSLDWERKGEEKWARVLGADVVSPFLILQSAFSAVRSASTAQNPWAMQIS